FALAWVGAFLVKIIGTAIFTSNPSSSITELVIGGGIILISVVIVYNKFTSKKSSGCSSCSGCPSNGSCSVEVQKEKVE
ncbi:MAG: FeoB-associated Cys-rich membrane protein, partial [Peptostreptococcaceae bacterium]